MIFPNQRLGNGSRMILEYNVRFCERLDVKLLLPTHHITGFALWNIRLEKAKFKWPALEQNCSGQLKLATFLAFTQYRLSDVRLHPKLIHII